MDGLILYLHGFRSSPLSWKVQALRQAMAERGRAERLLAPALPPAPAQAMILLESLICQSDGPITLVGSSLGGWYATWLAEKYDLEAVLINPAVVSELDLSSFMGPRPACTTTASSNSPRPMPGSCWRSTFPGRIRPATCCCWKPATGCWITAWPPTGMPVASR